MRRFILVLLACAAWAACGGKDPAAVTPSGDEVGTYTLVSLNGTAVPAPAPEGPAGMQVLSGTLTLGQGGTISVTVVFQVPGESSTRSNTVAGSYRRSGNALTFSYSNGGANGGTLNGADLNFLNEGVTWLYRKS